MITAVRAAALLAILASPAAVAIELTIGLLAPPTSSAVDGARVGLEEANVQGRFLGHHFQLRTLGRDDLPAAADGLSALVADADADALRRLAWLLAPVPVLNVGADDDRLRALCIRNLIHVLPSRRMRADAVAQWRRLHPGAEVRARAWHPALKKYAAAQLNSRYRQATGKDMDDVAWAAWAAVRLIADLAIRAGTADPPALTEALHTKLAFDGQKGVQMTLRPTGQLRQPLVIVGADGRLLGEAPVRGVVPVGALDTLGLADCPK